MLFDSFLWKIIIIMVPAENNIIFDYDIITIYRSDNV
jgi:hypothetical protein